MPSARTGRAFSPHSPPQLPLLAFAGSSVRPASVVSCFDFCFEVFDRVLQCSPGCSHSPPASASQGLCQQGCTSVPVPECVRAAPAAGCGLPGVCESSGPCPPERRPSPWRALCGSRALCCCLPASRESASSHLPSSSAYLRMPGMSTWGPAVRKLELWSEEGRSRRAPRPSSPAQLLPDGASHP